MSKHWLCWLEECYYLHYNGWFSALEQGSSHQCLDHTFLHNSGHLSVHLIHPPHRAVPISKVISKNSPWVVLRKTTKLKDCFAAYRTYHQHSHLKAGSWCSHGSKEGPVICMWIIAFNCSKTFLSVITTWQKNRKFA
jgi:hypothetical protein